MNEVGTSGFLRIANENDRTEVAKLLYKNGYTVSPVRVKKDGKSNEYMIKYDLLPKDLVIQDG